MKQGSDNTKIDPEVYYEGKTSDDFAITLIKRDPAIYQKLLAKQQAH